MEKNNEIGQKYEEVERWKKEFEKLYDNQSGIEKTLSDQLQQFNLRMKN